MLLDRNEIHIQAFVDFINGKLMSGHSSSSTFHDFIISSYSKINKKKKEKQKQKNKGSQKNLEVRYTGFPEFLRFSDSQISQIHIFKDVPIFFLYSLKYFDDNWEGYGSRF